jgi:hypothetical protein
MGSKDKIMKRLLIGLSLLIISLQSTIAGTIENRRTGEVLSFELTSDNYLEIYNRDNLLKKLNFTYIRADRSYTNLLAGNLLADVIFYENIDLTLSPISYDYQSDFGPDLALSVLIPIYNVPRVLGTVYDVVALPFKVTGKLFKNLKYRRDFNKLSIAVNTQSAVKVSGLRFRRIQKLLGIH